MSANHNKDRTADVIKIAAVATAMPRWVAALLVAEGFVVPETWLAWWVPLSALLSAGMAIVEGLAFAYVFNAWREQSNSRATRLLALAVISGTVFTLVLAPYIAAQVKHQALGDVLGNGILWWLWSAGVAASTILIVASVGYAQKPVTRGDRGVTSVAQHDPTDALLRYYHDNPDATQRQAGDAVGRSRQWVSRELTRLEESGQIERGNGNGVVIVQDR